MIKAVLFDMDGTLLPMDYDTFANGYFSLLAKKMQPYGYDPKELISGVWAATKAMVKNDGKMYNCDVFWNKFIEIFPQGEADKKIFDSFYENEFDNARTLCDPDALIKNAVYKIKALGMRTIVATNPIFPKTAIYKRIKWACLDPDDFEYISTYGNSHYCKPNPKYYLEIAQKLSLKPEECIMVGNDMTEDLAAADTGMKVFIIDKCLINKENKDIALYPHGDFNALVDYISNCAKQNQSEIN